MSYLYRHQLLTKNNLKICIKDEQGNFVNPFSITYTIFRRIKGFAINKVAPIPPKHHANVNDHDDEDIFEDNTLLDFQRLHNQNAPPPPTNFNLVGDATFAISQINSVPIEEPIKETINSVPIPFGIGKFYAAWQMQQDIEIGTYRIHWYTRRYSDSPTLESLEEFQIVARSTFAADAVGTPMEQGFQGAPAL